MKWRELIYFVFKVLQRAAVFQLSVLQNFDEVIALQSTCRDLIHRRALLYIISEAFAVLFFFGLLVLFVVV